jgi:plasmid stability protein
MTMLQIRNVPDDVHRRLKSRAALAGMSLSEFALAELQRSLDRPTRSDLVEQLTARPRRRYRTAPSALVRHDRDDRAGR